MAQIWRQWTLGLMAVLFAVAGGLPAFGEPAVTSGSVARLVVLFPQVVGAVYVLGLQDSVIGLPKDRLKMARDAKDGFYYRFAPNIGSSEDVGFPGKPNMETLFALHPDLVLSTDETVHPTPANKLLRENGIKVLALKAGFGSVDEWLMAVRLIAKHTGREGQALRYEAFFRERLRLVRERVAGIAEEKKPKVALVNTNNGQLIIRGARTRFGHELIRIAGGRTIAPGNDSGDLNANAELLFKFDPDIVIDDTLTNMLETVSWWKELNAVKNNKIYRTPQDDPGSFVTNWSMNTFSPLGLLWLAKMFHPAEFADIDLDAERNAFYKTVFGAEYRPYPPAVEANDAGRDR